EADEVADGLRLVARLGIAPRDGGHRLPGDRRVPVPRPPLVRAHRRERARLEEVHANVGLREVVARRERRLEEDPRPRALGDELAADANTDGTRARERLDPVERVVRVPDELLVLLEPAIRGRPGDADVALDLRLALGFDRDVLGRKR